MPESDRENEGKTIGGVLQICAYTALGQFQAGALEAVSTYFRVLHGVL